MSFNTNVSNLENNYYNKTRINEKLSKLHTDLIERIDKLENKLDNLEKDMNKKLENITIAVNIPSEIISNNYDNNTDKIKEGSIMQCILKNTKVKTYKPQLFILKPINVWNL